MGFTGTFIKPHCIYPYIYLYIIIKSIAIVIVARYRIWFIDNSWVESRCFWRDFVIIITRCLKSNHYSDTNDASGCLEHDNHCSTSGVSKKCICSVCDRIMSTCSEDWKPPNFKFHKRSRMINSNSRSKLLEIKCRFLGGVRTILRLLKVCL